MQPDQDLTYVWRTLPEGKYNNTTTEEAMKGYILTVVLAGLGYGFSAHIMGKDFNRYAMYGGAIAIFTEAMSMAYAKRVRRRNKK